MSFKVETPYGNPFEASNNQSKGWFLAGILFGVFFVLGICQIASWDGWKSGPTGEPPPSAGPGLPERPNQPGYTPPR